MLGGDFNAVTSPQDRLFGNPVSYAETMDFNECIQEAKLTELSWKGEYYTWTNKQQGLDRIYSRIDKLFGNGEWMSKCGNVVAEYDCPNVSDHAPMFLAIKTISWNIEVPFRFFNIWATQPIQHHCSKRVGKREEWRSHEESMVKSENTKA